MSQIRAIEIDKAYEAYDHQPLDEPDEWGDLASFLAANLRHKKEMRTSREPGP